MAHEDQLGERLTALGKSLRDRRRTLGISQEELADRCGLHRTYVGAVERGERNITLASLWTLADALGADARDLL